jgi:hypothetical protein
VLQFLFILFEFLVASLNRGMGDSTCRPEEGEGAWHSWSRMENKLFVFIVDGNGRLELAHGAAAIVRHPDVGPVKGYSKWVGADSKGS